MAAAIDADDLMACRALLRSGSRTFHAASVFLPRPIRDAATALYAFCRVADDVIDSGGDSREGVARLHERLARIYRGVPAPYAADRAFAAVVQHYTIPRALPAALLEGFAWDAEGRQYATLEELSGYAARVAGTVGAMMSLLMGTRTPDVIARACDLGVAMQYTNIARDVGEDARAGRLYLPRQWLAEEGIDPDAWLRHPAFTPAIGRVVARLLDEADRLYRRAETGIGALPAGCRPGMQAARHIYAAIGHEVARRQFDSVSSRAYVGTARKAALLLVACGATMASGPVVRTPALPATEFLVAAVADSMPETRIAEIPPGALEDRVVWLLDLFERLERRGRAQPGWG